MAGSDDIKRNTKDIERAILVALAETLPVIGRDLVAKAAPRAPKDTGDLRASHTWEVEGTSGFERGFADERIEMKLSVGSDLPYAAKQHNDESLHHTHGEARWLEQAHLQNIPTYMRIAYEAVQQTLARFEQETAAE